MHLTPEDTEKRLLAVVGMVARDGLSAGCGSITRRLSRC
jgi:hypothetical protein